MQINGHTILTTSEMMIQTGQSRSTLVRLANRGIPGANWDNYTNRWEWNLEEFLAAKLEKRGKPTKQEPHGGTCATKKRGKRGRFEVVK